MSPGSNCIRACRSDTGVHGPDCEEEEEAGARLGEIRYCNKRKAKKTKREQLFICQISGII